jgi:hypothetical protein
MRTCKPDARAGFPVERLGILSWRWLRRNCPIPREQRRNCVNNIKCIMAEKGISGRDLSVQVGMEPSNFAKVVLGYRGDDRYSCRQGTVVGKACRQGTHTLTRFYPDLPGQLTKCVPSCSLQNPDNFSKVDSHFDATRERHISGTSRPLA